MIYHTGSSKYFISPINTTLSLCSLRLMITAVICWSMKMRMVAKRAGGIAIKAAYQGLELENPLIIQFLSFLVG